MAVTFMKSAKTNKTLLGYLSEEFGAIEEILTSQGVEVIYSFYSIQIKKGKFERVILLPATPTYLMQAPSSDPMLVVARNRVVAVLGELQIEDGVCIIPGEPAFHQLDSIPAPKPAPKPKKAAKKPSPAQKGVVPLEDSCEVGQKVKGTSEGSTYVTVALRGEFKVAARLEGKTLSIRAVGLDTVGVNKSLLQDIKLTKKENYWSTHLDVGTVGYERVLGSFLFGLGVSFDESLSAGETIL